MRAQDRGGGEGRGSPSSFQLRSARTPRRAKLKLGPRLVLSRHSGCDSCNVFANVIKTQQTTTVSTGRSSNNNINNKNAPDTYFSFLPTPKTPQKKATICLSGGEKESKPKKNKNKKLLSFFYQRWKDREINGAVRAGAGVLPVCRPGGPGWRYRRC